MVNPFTDATTQNIGTTLAEVGGQQVEAKSALPAPVVDRTARLAAVALNPDQVLDNYNGLTAKYAEDIKFSGDNTIRYQAAAKETEQNLRGIYGAMQTAPDEDPTGQLTAGLQGAAKAEIDADLQDKARYALEKQAYQNIQQLAATDPTQAKVLMDQIQHGGAEDQIHDLQIKKMVLASLVSKSESEVSDQPWYRGVADFVASTIGSVTFKNSFDRGGNVPVDESMRHWWDFVFSGRRTRNEASTLYSLPLDEFSRTVEEHMLPAINAHISTFGYANHSEALNLLSDIANTRPTGDINAEDSLNLAGLIPLERLVSIPSLMIRAGARREAADLIAGATLESVRSGTEAASAATGLTEQEIINGNLPTALNTTGPINTVPVTGDALAGVERGRALAAEIPELVEATQAGRMTNTEFTEAVQKTRERISAQYGRELKDYNVVPNRLSSGQTLYNLEFSLGKKKGGGFSSKTIAEQQARTMGVGTHDIVQDDSGQWFIRETRDLPETSFYTTNLDPGLKKTGIVGRVLLGARQIDDDLLFEQGRASANARNKILAGIKKDFGKKFEGVFHTPEGDYLSNAAAWGENKGTWLSRDDLDELFARQGSTQPISDKAWGAYNAMRDINDVEFALRNDVDYATKATKGFETASFDSNGYKAERANALIDRHPQALPEAGEARVFDASTGIHYSKAHNPLTIERLKQMADDGYALVQLEEPIDAGGITVKHFLIKKSELEIERLRRDQLAYRAGGHRLYADKYFAKQAAWGIQNDTKEEFLKSPNVFISGTRAEVEHWTNAMDLARQSAKAGASTDVLDEVLASLQGWDGERFMNLVDQGKIDLNSEIKAMYDREMPDEYIQTPTAAQFHTPDEAGYSGWLRTNGRMYYSSKGDALEDWSGNVARTVDPFETTNMAIANVANLASFADYKNSAVTRWVDTFKDYLTYGTVPKGASDLTKFAEARYNSNLDQKAMFGGDRIRQRMEAQREIIKRNLGWRTDWDRRMESWQANINAYVMGHDPTSARHEIARKLTNYWAESNPINAVRGFVFDTKMGFFNIAQFPLQIQTMLSTAALAGFKEAGPAFMNFPLMRRYLMGREANEQFIEQGLQLGLHRAHGMEPEEYRVMMRMAKRSGFFEIHNSHQMMNYFGPNAIIGGAKTTYNQFMQAGRFFFNEGEMWNRTMAWQVAFKEISKTIHWPNAASEANVAQFYEEFGRKVAARADDYSINMTKESGAAWQHGLMSIPTQFWAYNARMLETYFGKQFTTNQKIRLALAQTFFYGAAGVPIAGFVSDMVKKNQGKAPPLDSLQGMIDRGGLDEVIWHMTGANVLAGKRYGTGSWMTDVVQELLGSSPYGEKSFAEVAGGSTYQILGDTLKSFQDLVKYATAESGAQDYPLTREGVLRLAKNLSTFSYGLKAYTAFQYRTFYSNKGTLAADNLPTADAFYFALGMQPGEVDDNAAMMAWKKDRKAQVDEVSKFIVNQRARLATEPQHRDEIAEEVNAMLKTIPPDLRVQALKAAHHRTPLSLHESLAQQVEREKKLQEQLNAYGQTN